MKMNLIEFADSITDLVYENESLRCENEFLKEQLKKKNELLDSLHGIQVDTFNRAIDKLA